MNFALQAGQKKVLWNFKNFQKELFDNAFLKVLGGHGTLFQKGSMWGFGGKAPQ